MNPGGSKDASLRHQMAVLRRRWPVVVLLAVITGLTAAVVTSRREPVYGATASILLQPVRSGAVGGATPTVANPNETATEIEVMLSQGVRDAVRGKVGHDPRVKIEARGVTSVIDIRARSTDPNVAADDATEYGEVYIDQRRAQRLTELQKAGELVQDQLTELDKQLGDLQKPLREADARLNATADQKARAQLQSARDAVADAISGQRRNLERRRAELDDQLNQIEVARRLDPAGGVKLVSSAKVPTSPVSASPLRNGALGLAGGLVLGIALAFLLDQLDDRLRRKDELEAAVGRPVLGLLPRVARRGHGDGILALDSPSSAAAESYRTLRTSLQFMAIGQPIHSVQVTSPTSAEGKTTVVTNLAASFAQAGQRVIILDCDLRRPKVHEAFGLPNERGFTSVLLDKQSLAEAITTVDREPYLAVLTSGPIPPNPSEVLNSDRAHAILATLRDNCDILLIDTPPVLPVTDALVVSRHVDATLLVARSKRSTKRQIARANELLKQVNAPLVGTVLNGVVHESGDRYGYGYTGYGTQAPPPRPRREKRNGAVNPIEYGATSDPPEMEGVAAGRRGPAKPSHRSD